MKATLAELEGVLAVARHGGFRAAARTLGVSSSALSHAVAALEERLAVRLFNRTTRSVSLTEAGADLVAEIGPALGTIDAALAAMGSRASEPAGRLRLNMAAGAARMILQPLLAEYARRYPRVSLEVVTDDALVDVIAEGFDAGVRLHEAVPPDMIAVPIIRQLRMIVVASPGYLAGRPVPHVPHDLLAHTCIQHRLAGGRIYRWEFERRGPALTLEVPGHVILDSGELLTMAAQEGLGFAYVEQRGAAPALADGSLVQVLDEWTPPFPGLSLYYPGRRHLPLNLRALVDLIREQDAG